MRTRASKLRREERAAIKVKNKRVATAKARLTKQAAHVAAKVARKRRPAERIMEGLKDAVTFIATDGREGGNVVSENAATATPDTLGEQLRHVELNARFAGEHIQMQRQNDDIVCSMMSVIAHAHNMPHHAPWTISAAEVRALVEVLERAGYSAHGRRTVPNDTSPSEVAKAS